MRSKEFERCVKNVAWRNMSKNCVKMPNEKE